MPSYSRIAIVIFQMHGKTEFNIIFVFHFPSTLKTKLEVLVSFFVFSPLRTTELSAIAISGFHHLFSYGIEKRNFVSRFLVLLW